MSLLTNLEFYYACEDTTDSSINGYNLTATGSPSSVTGRINNGFSYTSGARHSQSYNTHLSAGTFQIWVYPTGSGDNGRTLNKTQSGVTDNFIVRVGGNVKPTCMLHDVDVYPSGGASLTQNAWNHLLFTWNGTNEECWVNGVSQGATANAVDLPANAQLFYIGARADGTEQYAGTLDSVGMWSRKLTSTEIGQLYNAGAGLEYPFTVTSPSSSVSPSMSPSASVSPSSSISRSPSASISPSSSSSSSPSPSASPSASISPSSSISRSPSASLSPSSSMSPSVSPSSSRSPSSSVSPSISQSASISPSPSFMSDARPAVSTFIQDYK